MTTDPAVNLSIRGNSMNGRDQILNMPKAGAYFTAAPTIRPESLSTDPATPATTNAQVMAHRAGSAQVDVRSAGSPPKTAAPLRPSSSGRRGSP